MYQVTITWFNGTTPLRAIVSKETLRGFRLASIKDAAIKIVKVRS
jgi:hypothetical protein